MLAKCLEPLLRSHATSRLDQALLMMFVQRRVHKVFNIVLTFYLPGFKSNLEHVQTVLKTILGELSHIVFGAGFGAGKTGHV